MVLSLADARRESPAESELAYICHGLGYPLEPQVPLQGASGTCFRVDNVIVGTAVILEYDGRDKYDGQAALLQEKAREDDLRATGWQFVRATADCLRRPALLDRMIRAALALTQDRPPPRQVTATDPRLTRKPPR